VTSLLVAPGAYSQLYCGILVWPLCISVCQWIKWC